MTLESVGASMRFRPSRPVINPHDATSSRSVSRAKPGRAEPMAGEAKEPRTRLQYHSPGSESARYSRWLADRRRLRLRPTQSMKATGAIGPVRAAWLSLPAATAIVVPSSIKNMAMIGSGSRLSFLASSGFGDRRDTCRTQPR